MLESKKSLIFLISAVSLGVGVFIIYVLSTAVTPNLDESPEKAQFSGIFSEKKDKKDTEYYSEDFITPAVEAINETISSFFEEETPSPSVFSNPSTPAKSPTDIQAGKPSQPGVSITEQEIFEFGYDKAHLETLAQFKVVMQNQGFISQGEAYPLTNMQEAIILQDKFADFLEVKSDLSDQDLERYRYAYRTLLPKLWEQEYRATLSNAYFPSKFWNRLQVTLTKKRIAQMIKFIPEANAQAGCYTEGVPNLIRGSQRAAPCCNCYAGVVPIGCLNAVCSGKPAIYDSTTGICACYI